MTESQDLKRINTLSHKRGTVESQLTHFKRFLDQSSEDMDLEKLKVRVEKLDQTMMTFDDLQTELELLQPEVDHASERQIILDSYYDLLAKANRFIKTSLTVATTSHSNTNDRNITSHSSNAAIKLPKIDLPKFDGSYENWLNFQDAFVSMIDHQSGLSNVQKLQYLRSSLIGEAAKVVQSFETTDDNYKEAWNLLKLTYDNNRVIILRHITLLFDLPSLKRESANDLRELINNAQQHIRALKSLNQPVEHWDALLVHIMLSKLDKNTRREWERTLTDTSMPNYESLIAFLRQAALYSDTVTSSSTNLQTKPGFHIHKKGTSFNHSRNTFALSTTASCPISKEAHMIYKCEKFLSLSISDRINAAKEAYLCLNCLRQGHKTSQYKHGKQIRCRALLDTCSNTSFITEKLASTLGISKVNWSIPIGGLNEMQTMTKHLVTATIQSRFNNYSKTISCLTVPQITGLVPNHQIDRSTFHIPGNITLADPTFHKPAEIDMLLSSGTTLSVFCVGQLNLHPHNGHNVTLQKTKLGWVIGGSMMPSTSRSIKRNCHLADLQFDVSKFWEIEEGCSIRHLSQEEKTCEDYFLSTTERDTTGRYIVRLPFNTKKSQLGDSYKIALKRFYSTERRLQQDQALREQYVNFLREYIQLGHMSEVENHSNTNDGFYLPHHGVIKDSSLTTKLRVVFDGSAQSNTGISLNEALMTGPTIQDDIFSLILRFRLHVYVLTGDIEKMYRQIIVKKEDRRYQTILWRETDKEKIRTYELNTVTYGLTSAPYLAVRCLHQLANDEGHNYPNAARIIKRDFYVDDLLTGRATYEEAKSLRDELINLLQLGGFNLRQWSSNEPSLLKGLSENNIKLNLQLDSDKTIKTLGIYWNAQEDAITYTVKPVITPKRITKRSILSEIAKIFDPLGLLAPVILPAKLIMQKLWQQKLNWDESVPTSMHTEWTAYIYQLHSLNNISFSRRSTLEDTQDLQLHGFCDASEKAYGACIYLRSADDQGNIKVTLLCAKSRVAPLKSVSLPRLELCGALLLATLYTTVNQAMTLKINKTVFWSDSTITLQWINTSPHMLIVYYTTRAESLRFVRDDARGEAEGIRLRSSRL